ncbi:hypothetical protein Tco_0949512 [Tanacetum coccineum]
MRSFFVILHTLFDQTGRRSHIDTYVVSGVERKKEIEVKVAAARLLQKKQDVDFSSRSTRSRAQLQALDKRSNLCIEETMSQLEKMTTKRNEDVGNLGKTIG